MAPWPGEPHGGGMQALEPWSPVHRVTPMLNTPALVALGAMALGVLAVGALSRRPGPIRWLLRG